MDSSFFLTTVAAAIGLLTLLRTLGLFTLFRKLRFHQDNCSSSSSPSSSLSPSPVPPPSSSSIWTHDVFPSIRGEDVRRDFFSHIQMDFFREDVRRDFFSDIWTHDVFPSFRGEDVRRTFLSHIQMEFERKGITPFIDNEIRRGEYIAPELIKAIRGSKIAIILLSRNYASSKWCLDELVEIMNCREELGQTVMAILYKVDPSDVRKLAGDFGRVFTKTCAGKTKECIERWRQALAKVATIAG